MEQGPTQPTPLTPEERKILEERKRELLEEKAQLQGEDTVPTPPKRRGGWKKHVRTGAWVAGELGLLGVAGYMAKKVYDARTTLSDTRADQEEKKKGGVVRVFDRIIENDSILGMSLSGEESKKINEGGYIEKVENGKRIYYRRGNEITKIYADEGMVEYYNKEGKKLQGKTLISKEELIGYRRDGLTIKSPYDATETKETPAKAKEEKKGTEPSAPTEVPPPPTASTGEKPEVTSDNLKKEMRKIKTEVVENLISKEKRLAKLKSKGYTEHKKNDGHKYWVLKVEEGGLIAKVIFYDNGKAEYYDKDGKLLDTSTLSDEDAKGLNEEAGLQIELKN